MKFAVELTVEFEALNETLAEEVLDEIINATNQIGYVADVTYLGERAES